MPVDNDTIVTKIQLINARSSTLTDELNELRRIKKNLADIQDYPDPTDETKSMRQKDERTGVKFTDQARQKIYDQALIDVTAALP